MSLGKPTTIESPSCPHGLHPAVCQECAEGKQTRREDGTGETGGGEIVFPKPELGDGSPFVKNALDDEPDLAAARREIENLPATPSADKKTRSKENEPSPLPSLSQLIRDQIIVFGGQSRPEMLKKQNGELLRRSGVRWYSFNKNARRKAFLEADLREEAETGVPIDIALNPDGRIEAYQYGRQRLYAAAQHGVHPDKIPVQAVALSQPGLFPNRHCVGYANATLGDVLRTARRLHGEAFLQSEPGEFVPESPAEKERLLADMLASLADMIKSSHYDDALAFLANFPRPDALRRTGILLSPGARPEKNVMFVRPEAGLEPMYEVGLRTDNEEDKGMALFSALELIAKRLRAIKKSNLSTRAREYGLRPEDYADIGAYFEDQGLSGLPGHESIASTDFFQSLQYKKKVTLQALSEAYPGVNFKVFASNGSTACIFYREEQPDVLYKVASPRRGEATRADDPADFHLGDSDQKYFKKEAEMLALLSQADIAPKLLGYLPQSGEAEENNNPSSGKSSRLPIIVMERVDFDPEAIKNSPPGQRRRWAKHLIRTLKRLSVWPGDVELVVDKRTQEIKIIDVAGAMKLDPDKPTSEKDPIKNRVRTLFAYYCE